MTSPNNSCEGDLCYSYPDQQIKAYSKETGVKANRKQAAGKS